MAIWPVSENGDENSSFSSNYTTLFTPPNSCSVAIDPMLVSPRLEVGHIDAVPFSHNFADLFDDLGLHSAPSNEMPWRIAGTRSPDTSYEIESYTDIKELDPEWKHNEIEEILILSPKRPGGLPTIHEDVAEMSVNLTLDDKAGTALSDFEIEELDQTCSKGGLTNNTKICTRRDDKSGKKYLIKRRRIRNGSGWVERNILEILTTQSLPFVENMRWAFRSGEHSYIVFDYHPGITLADLITQHGSLGSHRAMFYAAELVSAISSLHDVGIVHRDIRPQNVVLDAKGHIVLTSFTHAETSHGNCSGRSEGSLASNFADSAAYRMDEYSAPELYLGWSHDQAVDCWSFGMIMYFMFFLRHPYGEPESEDGDRWFYDRVVGSTIPGESLRLVHPMARDLILRCLERNASMRWTMDKIKTHGYFAQIDWSQVSTKKLDVPSFGGLAIELDRKNPSSESRKHRLSLHPSRFVNERQDPITPLSKPDFFHRSSEIASMSESNTQALSEDFRGPTNLSIPTVIREDESISISASTGHPCEEQQQKGQEDALDPAERMSRFWADIDRDEGGTATSTISLEFGESNGVHYTKAPKLRKHRSAIQTTHRLFSLSTSSFHNKLRRKPRSTSALRQSEVIHEPIKGLPVGVHQIGSGIGFTYNVPTAIPSKVSVCSIVPPTCSHLFHGRFSILNRGSKRGPSGRRVAKVTVETVEDEIVEVTDGFTADILQREDDCLEVIGQESENGIRHRTVLRDEVGNGTFIREMYRTPSWILSPPDNVPSPLVLVNSDPDSISSASSGSPPETELLTPATLVNSHEDFVGDEITISIPKGLKMDIDTDLSELAGAPDSTLRLVPRVPANMRLSYEGDCCDGTYQDKSTSSEDTSVVSVEVLT